MRLKLEDEDGYFYEFNFETDDEDDFMTIVDAVTEAVVKTKLDYWTSSS